MKINNRLTQLIGNRRMPLVILAITILAVAVGGPITALSQRNSQRYPRRDRDYQDRSYGYDRPGGRVRYEGIITNENSGKVLDVEARSYDNGANVHQWEYTGDENQIWQVISVGRNQYAIYNRRSGKVLDVADNELHRNGVNVLQYSWHGRNNQRWVIEEDRTGSLRIISVANRKCLDVKGQGRGNGNNVHMWDCGNHSSQRWSLRDR